MKALTCFLPALALGGAAILIVPGQESMGWDTIGGTLSAESQRDFRVRNNFTDFQSNDNEEIHLQFPGFDGAEMALWKAGVEWGSVAHGDGTGDPLQPVLGNGGANFDFFWVGNADAIGNNNNNIISTITSCGGGTTYAYCETPISNGWRIRFCDEWVWYDGPDDNSGGVDMQGVGCHELGHALGLGHSADGGATMFPTTSGPGSSGARSINADDQAGLQALYGTMSASKPVISSVSVSSGVVTITGSNFSATNGEVWFTSEDPTAAGVDPRVRVTGVSSTGGGTQIVLSVPANAGHGDVIVKQSTLGHSTLSNAYPLDLVGDSGATLTITSVVPSTIENLIPGTAETITINGTGFTLLTDVLVNGNPAFGTSTVVSTTEITLAWEPLSSLGLHTIGVDDGVESDSTTVSVIANTTPTLQVGNGDPLNEQIDFYFYTLGGQPGDIHYLLVSPSPVWSVLPGKILLHMGNVFQELIEVGIYVIPAQGTHGTFAYATGLSGTTLYWQSLDINLPIYSNWPMISSNLQSTYTP